MAETFDEYARTYGDDLNKGLAVSGESSDFFLDGRVRWLARRLDELGVRVDRVVDYGCGTGAAAPVLSRVLGAGSVVGIDSSSEQIAIARRDHPATEFLTADEFKPAPKNDLVYCNGVFHHIPPPGRMTVVRSINQCLRPGGFFALWENNPWNPGTRYIMSKVPFDRDAITLTGTEARRLVVEGGFEALQTDFLFIFPRALRALRGLEPYLAQFPLGAQYLVLGRKPPG
jgi:SAM-dependent methyltransferase